MDHGVLEILRIASQVLAWVVAAAVLAFFLWYGGRIVLSWFRASTGKLNAPRRDMRMLWKVVKLGDEVLEGFGLPDKIKFGVVISSDDMLAQTQTMLICPLISGVDDQTGMALAIMPWHVPVEIRQAPERRNGEIEFGRVYVLTKIVLPAGAGEVDQTGLDYGYLDEPSRVLLAKKLALWLPQFAKIGHI